MAIAYGWSKTADPGAEQSDGAEDERVGCLSKSIDEITVTNNI